MDEAWSMRRADLGHGLWLVHSTVRRMDAGDDPLQAPVIFDLAAVHREIDFRIHDVHRDARDNVWICTEFGLFRLVVRPNRFQRILWSKDTPQGFGKRVRGMRVVPKGAAADVDRLLVNTELEGFWSLDARSGSTIASDT